MNSKQQKEICKTLQIILWLWFGIITSFVSVNVVNIARLETQMKNINQRLEFLEINSITLKNHSQQK